MFSTFKWVKWIMIFLSINIAACTNYNQLRVVTIVVWWFWVYWFIKWVNCSKNHMVFVLWELKLQLEMDESDKEAIINILSFKNNEWIIKKTSSVNRIQILLLVFALIIGTLSWVLISTKQQWRSETSEGSYLWINWVEEILHSICFKRWSSLSKRCL